MLPSQRAQMTAARYSLLFSRGRIDVRVAHERRVVDARAVTGNQTETELIVNGPTLSVGERLPVCPERSEIRVTGNYLVVPIDVAMAKSREKRPDSSLGARPGEMNSPGLMEFNRLGHRFAIGYS